MSVLKGTNEILTSKRFNFMARGQTRVLLDIPLASTQFFRLLSCLIKGV